MKKLFFILLSLCFIFSVLTYSQIKVRIDRVTSPYGNSESKNYIMTIDTENYVKHNWAKWTFVSKSKVIANTSKLFECETWAIDKDGNRCLITYRIFYKDSVQKAKIIIHYNNGEFTYYGTVID